MATTSYAYTGARTTFVVPPQCTSVTFDGTGGDGGAAGGGSNHACGEHLVMTLAVTPGDVLYIRVGGGGGPAAGVDGGNGGYPNGGDGGSSAGSPTGHSGYGGGGNTEVRRNADTLAARIFVAAGAGGSCAAPGTPGSDVFGNGGGTTGENGKAHDAGGGGGGTPSAGGAAGAPGTGASNTAVAGSSGQGGRGSNHSGAGIYSGGGGGGGYFGGGGGGGSVNAAPSAGQGGGGSGYNDPAATAVTHTRGVFASTTRDNGALTLTYNVAPNVPSVDTLPDDFDLALPLDVVFTFSDNDPGDTLSSADIQWHLSGGADTTITGATLTSLGANKFKYTFAANTFAAFVNQYILIYVRTYDSKGAVSDWAPFHAIRPRTAPSPAATITPTPVIDSLSPSLGYTVPGTYTGVEIQVGSDVAGAFGTVLSDTVHSRVIGGYPSPYAWNVPYAYVNGTRYHFRIRYALNPGVWSAWATSAAILCAIAAPLTPTLVLTVFNDTASIKVDIDNPGPDPFAPLYNDLYRTNLDDGSDEMKIAANLAIDGTFTDSTPASMTTYRYRAVAVNATTSTSSD